MDINFLDIQIIDTQENNRDLSFENASVDSIKLVYNGQDDKFANILTSELQFSFLVKEGSVLDFFHLFTGSETRYKVELIDVSVANFPKKIWTGFLLPEQFSEPYKSGPYFVDFVATDRLALLKSKTFKNLSKKSVLEVLNIVLIQTGLIFPVYFSEAIQNAGFDIDYLDVEIDTESYIDESAEISFFEVLENILQSIGCVLFLFENKWWIIGLNKLKEEKIVIKKYENTGFLSLTFAGTENYTRNKVTSEFVANPNVGVISPLQKVTALWKRNLRENLTPLDVVTHLPVNIENDATDRTAKYWSLTTNKGVILKVYLLQAVLDFDYSLVDYGSNYGGYNALRHPAEINEGPYVSIDSVNAGALTITDLERNYITLEDSFFVNGSSDLERFASLKIEFFIQKNFNKSLPELEAYFEIAGKITGAENNGAGKVLFNTDGHDVSTGDFIEINSTGIYNGLFLVTAADSYKFSIDADFVATREGEYKILPFAKNFFFAITKKEFKTSTEEEIIFTNFITEGIPENRYGFNISQDNIRVVGVLELEKFLLEDDGWYNIRLYPHIKNEFLGNSLVFKTLNFNLKESEEVQLVKSRNIDYTTKLELNLFHSSSALGLSKKAFSFSEEFIERVEKNNIVPGELEVIPISYKRRDVLWFGMHFYYEVTLVLLDSDYEKLMGGYLLYVRRQGETELTPIDSNYYILGTNDLGQYILVQLIFHYHTFETIEETDTVIFKIEGEGVSLQYAEYWLNRWRRYDIDEDVPMNEALVNIYHDLLFEYNFIVTGTILRLVSPLDLISFTFKGEREFYPTNLAIDLHNNNTEITMIESKNKNVTDYE